MDMLSLIRNKKRGVLVSISAFSLFFIFYKIQNIFDNIIYTYIISRVSIFLLFFSLFYIFFAVFFLSFYGFLYRNSSLSRKSKIKNNPFHRFILELNGDLNEDGGDV